MKLIKETPHHKVWMAEGSDVFGNNGVYGKYLVVDTYHGGVKALLTNSGIEALTFEVVRTTVEIMADFLKAAIVEFSHKNTDFNRQRIIETEIGNWNAYAKKYGRLELVVTETFCRRQSLANKFAEIYEAL